MTPIIDEEKSKWGVIYVAPGGSGGGYCRDPNLIPHYNDMKWYYSVELSPDGPQEWDWKKCGTQLSSGVTIEAVDRLIRKNLDSIILSRGRQNELSVSEKLVRHITLTQSNRTNVIVQSTQDAIKSYNSAVKSGKRVGALLYGCTR